MLAAALLVAAHVYGWRVTHINLWEMVEPAGVRRALEIGAALLQPDVSILLDPVLRLTVETLFLALMGTTLGVLAAIPLSFLGSRNLMMHNPVARAIYYLIRTFFNLVRAIEPLILVIVFAVWVGLGPFPGVLALGFHSLGVLGKLYSEAIEGIDPGPLEAILATGATRLQMVVYGVVPQVIPGFISFTLYRWDTNVRSSTVMGLVGGGGIGFILVQYINLLEYRQAATALWCIAILVMALDYASARIRERVV